jgi:mutator family transposase
MSEDEVRRRERVIRIFPNEASTWRLVGAPLPEHDGVWQERKYLDMNACHEWKGLRLSALNARNRARQLTSQPKQSIYRNEFTENSDFSDYVPLQRRSNMHRIGLVLLALSLLTVAPSRALIGGCGGGRMGRMESVTGNTNEAMGGDVGASATAQKHGKLAAAELAYRVPVSNTAKD